MTFKHLNLLIVFEKNTVHTQQIFVLMKTNISLLIIPLQKTSSRRLGQDQYIRLVHMSSRRLQDIFKTSCQNVFKTSTRRIQDVFKTSSKRLQDMSQIRLEDIFKTF